MNQTLKQISSKLVALTFGQGIREANQKELLQHIVSLHKQTSSTNIINSVAKSLKQIVDYRMFAFVMKKEDGVNVWMDPRMYKKSIEDIIIQDFHLDRSQQISYINHKFEANEIQSDFDLNYLTFYEIAEEECYGRLYILNKSMSQEAPTDETIGLLLQGCGSALSKQLKIEKLKQDATIDSLTGCYNRRELANQLQRHMARAKRHQQPLSILMFDLDHFKKINDVHGHLCGDAVLTSVARLVKNHMRKGDILARYGGEEFIAILPATEKSRAIELADRLRKSIHKATIPFQTQSIEVTASFGVAEYSPGQNMSQFIDTADAMLYKAKRNGRNRVMPVMLKMVTQQTSRQINQPVAVPLPVM